MKQFDAVNETRSVPNVLVLVAEDMRFHMQAFLDLLKGEIVVDGQPVADLRRYRFGRGSSAFSKVDLFIVLDTGNHPTFFNDSRFLERLITLFAVDGDGTA